MFWRVEREPSVSSLPYLPSLPSAWTTRILSQSASSSSPMMMPQPVRTPCPMSERWQVIVTRPSSEIATKSFGSSRQPFGMPSAP